MIESKTRGRPKKAAYSTQFRVTVPISDSDVIEWIKNQYTLSNSVRILIKNFVAQHGFIDSTCLSVRETVPAIVHSKAKTVKRNVPKVESVEPHVQADIIKSEVAAVAEVEPEIEIVPEDDLNLLIPTASNKAESEPTGDVADMLQDILNKEGE